MDEWQVRGSNVRLLPTMKCLNLENHLKLKSNYYCYNIISPDVTDTYKHKKVHVLQIINHILVYGFHATSAVCYKLSLMI